MFSWGFDFRARRTRRHVIAFVLAIVMLVAAGPVATAAASKPSLTASSYRAKAKPLCVAAEKQLKSLPNPHTPSDPSRDFKDAMSAMQASIPIERTEVRGLSELQPPVALTALVKSGLNAKRELLGELLSIGQLLEHPTGTSQEQFAADLTTLAKIDNLDRRITTIWTQIGVPVCHW